MGLVKFGGGVAGISGKVGGTVYARNGAGAVARNWVKPTNPATAAQTSARTRFGNQSNGWSALTGAQRDAWNGSVLGLSRLNRIGESYQPKGRQIFLESSNNQAITLPFGGSGPFVFPPPDYIPPDNTDAKVAATQTAGVLDGLDGIDFQVGVTNFVVVEATPAMPNSKVNQTLNFRFLTVTNDTATPDLLAAYIAQYGSAVVAGNVITFRISVVSDTNGMRSAATIYAATIT